MADDGIINLSPVSGSFGALTRDQLLEIAKNPPPPERDRGGVGADPLGFHNKASQVNLPQLQAKATSDVGARVYHRQRKEEGTVIEVLASEEKVRVKRDDGSVYKARIENLTRLS